MSNVLYYAWLFQVSPRTPIWNNTWWGTLPQSRSAVRRVTPSLCLRGSWTRICENTPETILLFAMYAAPDSPRQAHWWDNFIWKYILISRWQWVNYVRELLIGIVRSNLFKMPAEHHVLLGEVLKLIYMYTHVHWHIQK